MGFSRFPASPLLLLRCKPMDNDELQVENGHFTRIVNPLIEKLTKMPFKGCELAVALFIIRKTYGFQKKQDEISLTQFQNGIERSRQTVVTALKNLQLVNIVRLVKRGSMKGDGNVYSINKYVETWKVVKMVRLVKRHKKPSLMGGANLVKTGRHTKETKESIQKKLPASQSDAGLIVELINSFKEVNPSFGRWYGNTTQRGACDRLIAIYGLGQVKKVVALLPRTNKIPYFPTIATPSQLEDKWVHLESALKEFVLVYQLHD